MDVATFLSTLNGIQEDVKSAFIQVQMKGQDLFFAVDVINAIVERLRVLADSTIPEYQELRQILKLVITHLPDNYTSEPENWRKALNRALSATVYLNDYPFKFIAIQKLILVELGDPLPACGLICRAINAGAPPDDLAYAVLIPHLRSVMFDDVDRVMAFISEMRQSYEQSPAVDSFLDRIETDLKIKGLSSVWGPSLRRDYARFIVKPGVIDRDTSILIVGPTGTSKTYISERIAANSPYPKFEKVNCAGKSAEADLERAFDSASREPTTIFLDEVYGLQLRIQEACLVEFGRSGLQLRIISASSDPIEVLATKLKADFLGRIKGWILPLKPIADNPDDVEEAILGLAEKYHMDIQRRVVEHLRNNYKWPYNHRELEQVMSALCLQCKAYGSGEVSVGVLQEIRQDLPDDTIKILEPLI